MDTLDTRADLAWAVAAFNNGANTRYAKYRAYLAGDQPLKFATAKFEEAFGGVFQEFAYNISETVVDAHADRMQVVGFGADNDTLSQKAQAIWDANGMDNREGQVEQEQFGMGDAYIAVEMVDGEPVLWPHLAHEMRVRYSETRPGELEAAARLWAVPGGPWRLNIWDTGYLYKFVADRQPKDHAIPKKPDVFAPMEVDGEAWPLENPVPGTVPVFHFPNNGRVNDYGVSEIRNVIPLQDALNKTVLDMMVAMEFYAFRQRVLLGVAIDPDDTAAQQQLQQFQTGLTRLLFIDGAEGKTPSIDEFGETNIAQYTGVIERFEKKIATVTKVPKNYLGLRTSDYTSGESKRMDETQFIAKIEDRQRSNGAIISAMMTYCLAATGESVKPGDIRVNWAPAAPISSDEQVERMAIMRRDIKLPLPTILREAGYEPTQIEAIMSEVAEEADANRSLFDMGAPLA